jgi:hypothetical protein
MGDQRWRDKKNASLFVCFIDGWIFQEQETKKEKILDMCANSGNVKRGGGNLLPMKSI